MIVEPRRILLVEDNPNDAELTMNALGKHLHPSHVDHVRDGEEALVILLDLKLPKVNGIEVLRDVKGDAQLRSTPVVVLTSSREERDLVESYQLGVNAYVVKPVDFEAFATAVRTLGMFWAIFNEPPPETRRKG
jgi:CheY-like chemotaxis protein